MPIKPHVRIGGSPEEGGNAAHFTILREMCILVAPPSHLGTSSCQIKLILALGGTLKNVEMLLNSPLIFERNAHSSAASQPPEDVLMPNKAHFGLRGALKKEFESESEALRNLTIIIILKCQSGTCHK